MPTCLYCGGELKTPIERFDDICSECDERMRIDQQTKRDAVTNHQDYLLRISNINHIRAEYGLTALDI